MWSPILSLNGQVKALSGTPRVQWERLGMWVPGINHGSEAFRFHPLEDVRELHQDLTDGACHRDVPHGHLPGVRERIRSELFPLLTKCNPPLLPLDPNNARHFPKVQRRGDPPGLAH